MKISVLLITKSWNPSIHDFNYIKELKHRNLDFEVLLGEGLNPSNQRNALAAQAQGDFLLFLDDDSIPDQQILERYFTTLQAFPGADIIGGPSLLVEDNNTLSLLSKNFFSSFFGIGPLRNRYNSFGNVRSASEKDLILCNLLMRRSFFLKTKGFNKGLYPGEENEFLKQHQSKAHILYDPHAVIYRQARSTFFLFLEQMFSYGKGRSKHISLNNSLEYLFIIPLLFSIYLLSLPFLLTYSWLYAAPMFVHALFAVLIPTKIEKISRFRFLYLLCPFFFSAGHFSYGLGLFVGFFQFNFFNKLHKEKKNGVVKIHMLKGFQKNISLNQNFL